MLLCSCMGCSNTHQHLQIKRPRYYSALAEAHFSLMSTESRESFRVWVENYGTVTFNWLSFWTNHKAFTCILSNQTLSIRQGAVRWWCGNFLLIRKRLYAILLTFLTAFSFPALRAYTSIASFVVDTFTIIQTRVGFALIDIYVK